MLRHGLESARLSWMAKNLHKKDPSNTLASMKTAREKRRS